MRSLHITEGQAISARWRSLTHTHLSKPPPDSALLVEQLARVLDETGSFSSTQKSLEFVREVALERIEPMIRIAQRLEVAFMVEVTSSDMTLLFEAQDVVFDEARMTNEKCPRRTRRESTRGDPVEDQSGFGEGCRRR